MVDYLKHKNLLSHRKMCKEILTFGIIEIEKISFNAIKFNHIKKM